MFNGDVTLSTADNAAFDFYRMYIYRKSYA